jgi:hypothetical protein
MVGPFLWDKSYETFLENVEEAPRMTIQAYHTGYKDRYGVIHKRKIEWPTQAKIKVSDKFICSTKQRAKGAFHLGPCKRVDQSKNSIKAYFDTFTLIIKFPHNFILKIFYGSLDPFIGWRSSIYGAWEPIHTVVFSFFIVDSHNYEINFNMLEHY